MMSNIPEDVLMTEGERFKVLMEHTEDAFEDDQQNDALAIAQAQLDKAMRILKDSGWLSPEQVRERGRKLMKSIVKVLDDNVDFTKYVPHAIGYVVDKMADYDPNDEFWQALNEETEKGKC